MKVMTGRTAATTCAAGHPSISETSSGNASDTRKNTMFKSFSCDWLKLALVQVLRSGWSIVILVGLSLFICSFSGRQAFMVWWLALSGVVLVGFSIFLGNLPYRLLKPEMHISRHACFWSWVVWGVGFVLICLSLLYASPLYLLVLEPLGAATGFLFCQWVARKGLLVWIQ
nr:MAG TPA: hypothetical protein [Caudoviricetes sp.]